MSQTEKSILGLVIEYPALFPILEDNAEGLFETQDNRLIFEKIKEFRGRGITPDFAMLYDALSAKVNASYLGSLMDTLLQTPPSLSESALIDKIRVIRERGAKIAALSKIQNFLKSPEIDFNEIIEICQAAKVNQAKREPSDFMAALNEYFAWKETRPTKIITGFPTFDRLTDHFNYGEIVAFMGRTTTGKTFTALNTLACLIQNGVTEIGFFSMEMSKAPLIERLMQIHFGLSRHDLVLKKQAGELDITGLLESYSRVKIYSYVYSPSEMAQIIDRDKLRVVYVDYLQLMKGDDGDSLYEKTTYKMNALKEIAKNKEVVVFLMVQISRKGEGGWEPVTIDMARDSGAIEENSDFIVGIWNPSLYGKLKEKDRERVRGKVFMRLLKNKRGPLAGIECIFDPQVGKLYEIEEGQGP